MQQIPRPALIIAAVVAVVGLALGGKSLAQQSQQNPPSGAPYEQRSAAKTPAPAGLVERGDERAVVHVAGAVRRPGVYKLGSGARVRDAVRRAGGASSDGDANAINLAAKVVDGAQVIVPLKAGKLAAAAAPAAAGAGSTAPISLGNATVEQLDTLDGVGPATAEKIIQWRTENGGFTSVDDLGEVPGIGPKKLEALRSQVTP
jgi:competence protein ComEA